MGYAPDEQVCIVTVGGSAVGQHLLERVIAAYPEAKRRLPALRMVVVTGPRIDPASLPQVEGLEIRSYVYELYRHLAVCDIAVVQGGLTTTMELTANKRPFLCRYGAGRCMDYQIATPESIAAALVEEINRPVQYRAVESDGAAHAAARIAELL